MSTICIKLSCIETSEIVGNDVYASSFLTIFRFGVERSGTEAPVRIPSGFSPNRNRQEWGKNKKTALIPVVSRLCLVADL